MEKSLLAKNLRALAQATDALLRNERIPLDEVAGVQRELAELQRQPIAGPGVDLVIANTVLRLRLKVTAAHFEPTAGRSRRFPLGWMFSRPLTAEEAARRQQQQVRKAVEAFRKELGDILFALVI